MTLKLLSRYFIGFCNIYIFYSTILSSPWALLGFPDGGTALSLIRHSASRIWRINQYWLNFSKLLITLYKVIHYSSHPCNISTKLLFMYDLINCCIYIIIVYRKRLVLCNQLCNMWQWRVVHLLGQAGIFFFLFSLYR